MADELYIKRKAELEKHNLKIQQRRAQGKKIDVPERLRRLEAQTDPRIPKQYGKSSGIGLTFRVPKKVRNLPWIDGLLKLPEGSVWHHVIESQTAKSLFEGIGPDRVKDLKKLNDIIAKSGMTLGNAYGAVMELPERLHKGGKATTNAIEDIHNWITKNTPKNASWTKLTPKSGMPERIAAAEDMAKFFHQSKRRIQEMQFASMQIGGMPEIGLSGKATKAGFVGGKLKPGWHGNFADWIKNPEVPENIRKHMIDYAKQFNKPAMLKRLKNLPPINLKSVAKSGVSMIKKSGGSPLRLVAGEVVDRGLRMGIDRALQTPQAQQLGRNIMRPLIRGARKIDDALPGVNSKDEALRIARQGTQQLDDVLLNNPVSKNPKLRDIQIDKLLKQAQ